MILSGIHDFNDLEAGFPTKTASGMTFCEIIRSAIRRLPEKKRYFFKFDFPFHFVTSITEKSI
jgi:hypothetical protein